MISSPSSSLLDISVAYKNAVHAFQQGKLTDADALCRSVLQHDPNHTHILTLYGLVLLGLRQWQQATDTYNRLLERQPQHVEALNNRAHALQQLGDIEAARASFDAAVAAAPSNPDILKNRGLLLLEMRNYAAALADFESSLSIRPNDADALNERGNALLKLNRLNEALASFDQAIALKPHNAAFHTHRGGALMRLRRMGEALAAYAIAQKNDPYHAKAHLNEAMCRLMVGDFAAGWAKYEHRWQCEPMNAAQKHFNVPLWLGESDIRGKTMLLHAEQGAGDTIQFCRYAPLLAARGARVLMQVPSPLKDLIASLDGVTGVFTETEALPSFDVHCPMMSLPLAFKTTAPNIPAQVPYLHSASDKADAWRKRLPQTGLRVGIVWSGDARHGEDHNRSIPFSALNPLLDTDATFLSLQKEYRADDKARVQQRHNMRDVSDELRDFADTAALITQLDLVISIDTSVAHLAGALGKPVWVLLPHVGLDWRWLIDRTNSPWYPTAQLYRQSEAGNWTNVIARAAQDIGQQRANEPKTAESAHSSPANLL